MKIMKENKMEEVNVNDMDFYDEYGTLINNHPKVIKVHEIFDKRMFKSLRMYFFDADLDLTKRNVRSIITEYLNFCKKPVVPIYMFWNDEDISDFIKECNENGLGELVDIREVVYEGGSSHHQHFLSVIHDRMGHLCSEIRKMDINSITKIMTNV